MSTSHNSIAFGALFGLFGCLTSVFAEYPITYPNCDNVTASDFKKTHLVGNPARLEPNITVKHAGTKSLVRFDLLRNGDDVDVFFGGFEGILYRYNSQTKQVEKIHDFQTIVGSVGKPHSSGDHGLIGINFHPDFESNRWLFVYYTPMVGGKENRVMRLSRFVMTEQYQLVNEKILLSIEATNTDRWHSGGDMYFTAQGDLWLQVGDNVIKDDGNTVKTNNAAWSSGNTTNLLGGIVRIHPDNSEKGYSVLKGNFGEHFAPLEGNPDYLDTIHVKAEIYAKGQRSNFYSTGHPTELIHIWGEIDSGNRHDELNIISEPMYGGWPHIQGDRESSYSGGTARRYPFTFDDVPTLSKIVAGDLVEPEAIQTLPMAAEADVVAGREFNNIVVHALYYYGKTDSIWHGRTFPPNFHETFIVGSFLKGNTTLTFPNHRIVPLIKDGAEGPTASFMDESYRMADLIPDDDPLKRGGIYWGMVEARYGPDGALYTMSRGEQYGNPTGLISRVDYIGNCQDPAFFNANKQEFITAKGQSTNSSRLREGFYEQALYTGTSIGSKAPSLGYGGTLNVQVYNIQGKMVGSFYSQVERSGKIPLWDGMLDSGKKSSEGIYFLKYLNIKGDLLFSLKQVLY